MRMSTSQGQGLYQRVSGPSSTAAEGCCGRGIQVLVLVVQARDASHNQLSAIAISGKKLRMLIFVCSKCCMSAKNLQKNHYTTKAISREKLYFLFWP